MRRVGDFKTEKLALRFWTYLKKKGVESSLEQVDSDNLKEWEIWVADEDKLSFAISLLNEFRTNPEDDKYEISSKEELKTKTTSHTGFKQFNLSLIHI